MRAYRVKGVIVHVIFIIPDTQTWRDDTQSEEGSSWFMEGTV